MSNVTHACVSCVTGRIKRGTRPNAFYFTQTIFHNEAVAKREMKSTNEVVKRGWIC